MLQNLTKYKEEMNMMKAEFRKKELDLSDTVSMFVVKNEQLVARNNQLNNKLATLEGKIKR